MGDVRIRTAPGQGELPHRGRRCSIALREALWSAAQSAALDPERARLNAAEREYDLRQRTSEAEDNRKLKTIQSGDSRRTPRRFAH